LASDTFFEWTLNNIPGVEDKFDKATEEMLKDVGGPDKVVGKDPDRFVTLELPSIGMGPKAVLDELKPFANKENDKWTKGKLSGTVYQDDPEHTELMNEAFKLYTWSNPLHAGYWKKLNQCESEVIAITSRILNAPDSIGALTSGGTESIICAIKASLFYYGKKRRIKSPEVICGTSAHAAVDK
jgi:glutamate/tyrosine decarboxylase-like PLP-dependent enzyme